MPEARGELIQARIIGVHAQIVLDLTGQDQLQVFQRGVVDEVVQRGALVEVAGELVFDRNAVYGQDYGASVPQLHAGGVDVVFTGSVFNIASTMMFSEVANENSLEKYNSIKSLIENGIAIVGPAVATIIYGLFGFGAISLIAAISYFASASAVITCVNVPLWSYLQTNVEINYQGRFFSIQSFLSNIGFTEKAVTH